MYVVNLHWSKPLTLWVGVEPFIELPQGNTIRRLVQWWGALPQDSHTCTEKRFFNNSHTSALQTDHGNCQGTDTYSYHRV
jgi:hypothetical protein